jgi:hypothetical protein
MAGVLAWWNPHLVCALVNASANGITFQVQNFDYLNQNF